MFNTDIESTALQYLPFQTSCIKCIFKDFKYCSLTFDQLRIQSFRTKLVSASIKHDQQMDAEQIYLRIEKNPTVKKIEHLPSFKYLILYTYTL